MLKLSSWRKSGGAFPTRRSGNSLLISERCSIGNQAQPGAGESRQQSGPERDQEPQAQESGVDLSDIDFVASVLDGYDRAYFNFMRWTGCRMDEANRARWEDVDFGGGSIEIRGSKTEASADTFRSHRLCVGSWSGIGAIIRTAS